MHPVVTRIIKINLHNESDIELVRGAVYAWEKRGSAFASDAYARVYGEGILDIAYEKNNRHCRNRSREIGASGGGEESGRIAQNNRTQQKIIERSKTEEEILAAIAAMETAETKDDTE